MGLIEGKFVGQPVGLIVLFYQLDVACRVRVISEKNPVLIFGGTKIMRIKCFESINLV